MEYFHSDGGNSRPVFIYRFKVKSVTIDMHRWAEQYPEKGPFSRWHVEWDSMSKMDDHRGYDVIQFESSDAAKVFRIAFAGEYEDITMKEFRLDKA